MNIKNCYTGTAIEQEEEGCGNNYISTNCVQTPNTISYLNISAGSTQTEINAAITSSLIFKDQQISEISSTKIEAGENVEITGIGTEEQPYIINALGGSNPQSLDETVSIGNIINDKEIFIYNTQGGEGSEIYLNLQHRALEIKSEPQGRETIIETDLLRLKNFNSITDISTNGLEFSVLGEFGGYDINTVIKLNPILSTGSFLNILTPNKSNGTYTLATTEDLNLQTILDSGDTWTRVDDGITKTINFSHDGLWGNESDIRITCVNSFGESEFRMTAASMGMSSISEEGILTTVNPGSLGKRITGLEETIINIKNPVAQTTLNFPAKENGGEYTIATLDDFKTINGESIVGTGDITLPIGGSQDLQSVMDNGSIWVNSGGTKGFGYDINPMLLGGSNVVFINEENQFYISDKGFSFHNGLGSLTTTLIFSGEIVEGKAQSFRLPTDKPSGDYYLATRDEVRPYKVYTALLNQTSTSTPTVEVLENTLGSIVWTRITTGMYWGTLVGAFPANKTHLSITPSSSTGNYSIFRNSDDIIVVKTQDNGTIPFTDSDDKLFNNSIRIEVYN